MGTEARHQTIEIELTPSAEGHKDTMLIHTKL
jgi:hypothetical protein